MVEMVPAAQLLGPLIKPTRKIILVISILHLKPACERGRASGSGVLPGKKCSLSSCVVGGPGIQPPNMAMPGVSAWGVGNLRCASQSRHGKYVNMRFKTGVAPRSGDLPGGTPPIIICYPEKKPWVAGQRQLGPIHSFIHSFSAPWPSVRAQCASAFFRPQ